MPFTAEDELFSGCNPTDSYAVECVLRKFITNVDDLDEHVRLYGQRHLYTQAATGEVRIGRQDVYIESHTSILQMLDELHEVFEPTFGALSNSEIAEHPDVALAEALGSIALPSTVKMKKALRRLPTHEQLSQDLELEVELIKQNGLTPDQQRAFDGITAQTSGLVMLTGGPGTGKSALTKMLLLNLTQQGKQTLITASTGAAATRLTTYASTVHSAFALPYHAETFLTSLPPHDPLYDVIRRTNVIFIDEYSMMPAPIFGRVMERLRAVHKVDSMEELLKKVLIVLVGDDAQVIKYFDTL